MIVKLRTKQVLFVKILVSFQRIKRVQFTQGTDRFSFSVCPRQVHQVCQLPQGIEDWSKIFMFMKNRYYYMFFKAVFICLSDA